MFCLQWVILSPHIQVFVLRVTVVRIYCTHETWAAFLQMWSGLWDTIEKVTGKFVHIRFIDGTGLHTILVDGYKPQVDACGDDCLN